MLVHKTNVVLNDDGTSTLVLELFGNQTELAAIAAGTFEVRAVKAPQVLHPDDPSQLIDNPDQLNIEVHLASVPFEVVTNPPSDSDVKLLGERARGGLPEYDTLAPHDAMRVADPVNAKDQKVTEQPKVLDAQVVDDTPARKAKSA